MATFLFAWNPIKWPWPELSEDIKVLKDDGVFVEQWTCASHKKVRPGDRAFLIRLGQKPLGIMGSGFISSEPFVGERAGKPKNFVLVNFEVLLDPDKEPLLSIEELRSGTLKQQHWSTQSSGISIKDNVADALEEAWQEFLSAANRR